MIDIRQNKGFALVFSLIFLFLIVSFMGVYILAVANGVTEASRAANMKKAYYAADAGLVDAYERILQAGRNFVIPANSAFIPSPTTDNGVFATGSYTVTVALTSTPTSSYIITSTGSFANATKTLQLQMSWASFSRYAYWSQTENNPQYGQLWWVGAPGMQMVTTGPVQTNGQLNIFGDPIFNGQVTESNLPVVNGVLGNTPTSSTPNYYYGTGNSGLQSNPAVIFPGGITNDAAPLPIPPQSTLSLINSEATSGGGLVLTGASTVIFNPTGTVTVTGNITDATGTVVTTAYNNTTINPPSNGIIYVQTQPGHVCSSTSYLPPVDPACGNVTVQGTVSGQLTVAADQNINVSGSIAYNKDPRTDPTSTDMVGLVAQQNITIIEQSAPAQLEMSAVLMAISGSFQVDQWWVNRGDANTAVMDQFGSLINYVCGVTGEMDMSGNLLGGWNQIQNYDSRLLTMSPPGFPPIVDASGKPVYSKLSIKEL